MFPAHSKLTVNPVNLLLIVLLTACTSSIGGSPQAPFSIDSTFSDFYRQTGGTDTLGPAISSAFVDEGITYQYVISGLMVYDPGEVALKRFHFSPLASLEWHLNGLPEPVPTDPTIPYLNGHQIWEEISTFYNRYGADIIGLPVTGVIANDTKQRYEQYFEGLGFYRSYADTPGQVHLLPYGVWMCGDRCPLQIPDSTPPMGSYIRQNTETEQLFLDASESLGYGFTGEPLVAPRLGADGDYEMIFENLILYIDPSAGDQIRMRPMPTLLGIQNENPGSEIKEDWLSFYPTQEGLGFNVPNIFITYLSVHGGTDYAGPPIAQLKTLIDSGYSQCFTNLCLEYHPSAPRGLVVRPHALGEEYLALGENVSASRNSPQEALQINAWEDDPLIASGEIQGINIETLQNNVPMSGLVFSLIVTQPDGITKTYTLEPTGADGKTRTKLDPINGPNGSIVQYEICLVGGDSPSICFTRSYTIWEQ